MARKHAEIPKDPGLLRRYVTCILFWNPLLCTFFTLVFSGFIRFGRDFPGALAVSCTVSTFCFGGVRLVQILERLLYRALRRAAPDHSGAWYLSLSCLLMPFGLHLGFGVAGWLSHRLGYSWSAPNLDDYRTGMLWGLAIAGFFTIWEGRRDAQIARGRAELRIRDLENERLRAQLEALTARMNPHLLFNALNTVASLVPTDPGLAEETILQLSELYRGVLVSSRKATHSLAEELELCRAYISVERARFGSRLESLIDVDAAIDPRTVEVPVLAIQSIVENAIRHGLASRSSGGRVRVDVRRDGATGFTLCVEDDGVGLGISTKRGTGTGLSNCRERLKLVYGEQGGIDLVDRPGGGTRVRIRIPVAPLAVMEAQ